MVAESLLDLIGNTPLVALRRLSPPGVLIYRRSSRGRTRPASIKDRVALAMVDCGTALEQASGGQELLEPDERQHGHLALALVQRLACGLRAHLRDARERDTRAALARARACTARCIVDSPAAEGSNWREFGLAQEMAAAERSRLH